MRKQAFNPATNASNNERWVYQPSLRNGFSSYQASSNFSCNQTLIND